MDLTNLNRDRKTRRKAPLDLSNVIYGKIPPQARDLEEAVLGAIMLERNAFEKATALLTYEMFYVDAHQRIFRAFEKLNAKSQPIDILTAVEELRSLDELDMVGGAHYVSRLTNSVVSSANLYAHADIIRNRWEKREIIRIAGDALNEAYENSTDVGELRERTQSALSQLGETGQVAEIKHISTVAVDVMRETEELRHRKDDLTGVPSGFEHLDKLTGGWQDTDLILLAARPSKGKTAMALNLARNAAQLLQVTQRPRKGVGVFSLEMRDRQQVQRILANEADMFLTTLRHARMDDEQMQHLLNAGVQKIAHLPIYIVDRGGLPIQQILNLSRRMVRMGCGLIIIDYLQLINGFLKDNRQQNREQEISYISRSLKALAMELHVPIIALSQLSREIEKRPDAEPVLSDLRESGSLEQDADMVMFLYGHDKLAIKKDPFKDSKVLIKIAKYRNGALDTLEFEFNRGKQRFTELGSVALHVPAVDAPGDGRWRRLQKHEISGNDDDMPF